MKKFLPVFLAFVLTAVACLSQPVKSHTLNFRNNVIQVKENVAAFDWDQFAAGHQVFGGQRQTAVLFINQPNENTRKALTNSGISLISYAANLTYLATFSKPVNKVLLQQLGIIAVFDVPLAAKKDYRLQRDALPKYAVIKPGTVDVLASIGSSFLMTDVLAQFAKLNYQVVDDRLQLYNVAVLRVPQSKVSELAGLPFITFVQPVSPADKKLNDEVRSNTRANILQAPLSAGGENLTGQGVVIGVGDDADATSHVDLADRIINRAAFLYQNHGTQTAGTAAGAGIKDPLYKGIAPKATIVSQIFGEVYKNADKYVNDYGMVVTNNSYGAITGDCQYAGVYDLYSKVLDEQAFTLPNLLHVFAAGNDGYISCNGYPQGYHAVLGGYQSAKNILSVGWGEKIPMASVLGSKGPTGDGRIKPDIIASGSEVRSTATNNGYVTDYGSSLSSPAVAGGAALVIEKYRQINGNATPKSGLVKALLMNGATDVDNPGPDYGSGYGWMNLTRSVAMLKDGHYITASAVTGGVTDQNINVPAGMGQLKVMLYWHDPAAAVFTASTLVNDLDLEVITPSNQSVLPWVLNPSPANVTAAATHGIDHVNNTEQVTIDNPAAGSYTIRVKGTAINVNTSQEYFIVYDFVPAVIKLTFPSVGEPLVAGETILIDWDAWDISNNTYTLQYSVDNGVNWTDISTNIPSSQHFFYNWVVPNVVTSQAKMRLMRNGTSLVDESLPFAIMTQPAVSLNTIRCRGYMGISWPAVSGATDYEVMMKQGAQMVPIATTAQTNFVVSGLNADSIYWMTMRPRINGIPGRRSVAVQLQPNTGTCQGSISDNDLSLDSIINPVTGRQFTQSAITGNNITIRVRNHDDVSANGLSVQYSVNGSAFQSQSFSSTISPLSTDLFQLTGPEMTAVGTYNIVAVVKNNATDNFAKNDTLSSVVKQLANPKITLPFTGNFESAAATELLRNKVGVDGIDRWDFIRSTSQGRLRTFVNTGIAHSGTKALTIDAAHFIQTGNLNYVIGTFNLSDYDAATQDVRFDFGGKIMVK